MTEAHGYLKQLLGNLRRVREQANLSEAYLEDRLILAQISHSENETSGRESKKCLRQRYLTDSWRCPDADTV